MIKKILCAIDFSEISKDVASYTHFLASKVNSKVYVIHVVKSLLWTEEFGTSLDFKEAYEKELYELAYKRMKEFVKIYFNNIDTSFEILKGDVIKEILNFAEKNNVDFLVIGAHGEHGIHDFIFGSVTEKIIKLSKVPVLVIK